MAKNLDLDVDHPDEVPYVLREAADEFYEAAVELEAAWGEKSAGSPWSKTAKILEQAADKIEKIVG